MKPLRDRLVRDVILDLVRDETLTAYIVAVLGVNPRAETLGDLEAGRAVLAWSREGRDVVLRARLVRAEDEDSTAVSVEVSPSVDNETWRSSLARGVVVDGDTPTRGVLAAVDLFAADSR